MSGENPRSHFSSSNIDLCKIGIVGFGCDVNSSFLRNTAEAPPLIRNAFSCPSSNLWSESGLDLGKEDIFFDAGDVWPNLNEDWMDVIEASISNLLAHALYPLSLGGDHSITYFIARALRRRYPKLSMLYIDAHPDLYDQFDGNKYSHASSCARIMEDRLVDRMVQVGIRTLNGHQREQAARLKVEICEMKDWHDQIEFNLETPIYISVDLDGLDPAFAPGVSHPEPGGLSTRDVIDLIHGLKQPVIGADIVEFNPGKDVHNLTAMVCAKLLKEISSKILESALSCEIKGQIVDSAA